jgi:ketosteroid isomerase-like protein
MTDIRSKVQNLVELTLGGRILDAFDTYYAENVTMAENLNAPTVGKEANRLREIAFLESVKEWHAGAADLILVDGSHAVIHWTMDITKTDGSRVKFDQLALQTWEDGLIVKEVFYYDPTAMTA